ncbi:MAG TPA: DoxX family protein [Candidatus Binatia bacterium]|jgi:putative oxidoreductase
MNSIVQTDPIFAFVFLRLSLAAVFFAHGAQQLLGWFGGKGPRDTINSWRERYSIPRPIGAIGIFTEFFGSFAMLFGFLTRPFALGLAIFMAVAIWKAHWKNGFFLAHRGGEGNGIEFCLALFLMALALLVGGGGTLSVDLLMSR